MSSLIVSMDSYILLTLARLQMGEQQITCDDVTLYFDIFLIILNISAISFHIYSLNMVPIVTIDFTMASTKYQGFLSPLTKLLI